MSILVIGSVLSVCGVVRADVILLDPDVGYKSEKPSLEFLDDETKTLTIDDVTSPEISKKFVRRAWEDRIQTEKSISTWIRFTLERKDTGNKQPDWFLHVGNPQVELLEFYYPIPSDDVAKIEYEMIRREGDPNHPYQTISIRLPFERGGAETCYLRLNQKWRDITRLSFATIRGSMAEMRGRVFNMGLFYGVMFVIAVVNLMFFLILKDKSYLWQVLFLLSTILFFFVDDRLIVEIFPRVAPDVHWRFLGFSVALILFWFGLFSRTFLGTKQNTPRLDKMVIGYMALNAGMMLLVPFLPISMIGRSISLIGALVPFVALIPGFICLKRGFYAARFYLAGWIVFSITTPLAATVFMGTHLGGRFLQIGIVVNACLLTLALVDRMRLMSKERAELEKAARETEKQMMHADKMVALGQVMAGIAHEINNPNNFIHFNLPIMKRYFEEIQPKLEDHYKRDPNLKLANMPYEMFVEDVYKLIENMHHGSSRITKIVGELKEYVHGGENEEKKPGSVEEVVQHALGLVGKQIQKSVRKLDVNIEPNLPMVRMNAGKIEQVLINLLVNAGHAADKEDSFIKLVVEKEQSRSGYVCLCIEDNGSGIPKDVQKKIFDPFFTTKERGVGTGLGLAISSKIIEDHSGTIDVSSQKGKGTTFTISLPMLSD